MRIEKWTIGARTMPAFLNAVAAFTVALTAVPSAGQGGALDDAVEASVIVVLNSSTAAVDVGASDGVAAGDRLKITRKYLIVNAAGEVVSVRAVDVGTATVTEARADTALIAAAGGAVLRDGDTARTAAVFPAGYMLTIDVDGRAIMTRCEGVFALTTETVSFRPEASCAYLDGRWFSAPVTDISMAGSDRRTVAAEQLLITDVRGQGIDGAFFFDDRVAREVGGAAGGWAAVEMVWTVVTGAPPTGQFFYHQPPR